MMSEKKITYLAPKLVVFNDPWPLPETIRKKPEIIITVEQFKMSMLSY